MLNLFRAPPTDLSILSYRMVPIHPFTMGPNLIDFQIDPKDYIDLSCSYFELEWTLKKSDGNNTAANDRSYLVNNIAHSIFKQISVRLNGMLISPQTDTYHNKAYIETLLNYNRDDGETVLKPQGWFNAIDLLDTLTANRLDQTHNDFGALSEEYQHVVKTIQSENSKHAGGKARIFCFVPHIEVFHLSVDHEISRDHSVLFECCRHQSEIASLPSATQSLRLQGIDELTWTVEKGL